MEEMEVCHVRLILNNKEFYIGRKEFNQAELKALEISKSIYADRKYYDIESIVFNYDDKTLEIHIK